MLFAGRLLFFLCDLDMAKTKHTSPLDPQQVVALLQLALNYHDQSKKSYDADAPLASCIMIGATLEAVLTAVVCMLYDQALKTGKAPAKKPLLKWNLGDLLKVAKAAKWLPKDLQLDPRLDPLGIRTVPIDSIRQIRNFVHPARYFTERVGNPYTVEEVRTLYAACHTAYDCVISQLRARFPHLPSF
jgi:hypothetical protein